NPEISRCRQSRLFECRRHGARDWKTFERILPRLLYRQLSPPRRSRARQVHHGKARSPRQSTRRAGTASDVVRGPEVTRSRIFILSFRAKSRNGASGTSEMNDYAAKEAARETGDERVQSIVVSEIVRDVSAPLDMTRKKAYARAGVDVDLGNKLKRRIQSLVRQTHGAHVLGKIGGFGGLFRVQFSGMRDPVLVASIDSVGTKLKIAFAMNKHDTVGADMVNHCVNDIAVFGARPLFFLDYIGCEKLQPRVFDQLIGGMSRACRLADCALIGGETAQMPGMYRKGEYDLAGCIVGVVDRTKVIDGSNIKPGDVVLGLASNGLHTNGYSLARKILFEKMGLKPSSPLPGSAIIVGKELLRVHQNYQPLLAKIQT